ncbi:hypothetical protein [Pantoea sp. UBA6567]|uniref:hypothetical protein n=1 Tax=Pantoea sp. UBA6567 TaxID=1947043 RepID=UPI0025996609|nr:hypothetical protein [Pantoea sp. UBA6567]
MDYFIYFEAALLAFLAVFIAISARSHGVYERFLYVDKRQKHVNLHLMIFRTPRKKSGAYKVVKSLERCLQHLKTNGYKSATLESHLIDNKRMGSVYRLARKHGYSVTNVSEFHTPKWQRFSIPLDMALVRFKIKFANSTSMKLTIVLN